MAWPWHRRYGEVKAEVTARAIGILIDALLNLAYRYFCRLVYLCEYVRRRPTTDDDDDNALMGWLFWVAGSAHLDIVPTLKGLL